MHLASIGCMQESIISCTNRTTVSIPIPYLTRSYVTMQSTSSGKMVTCQIGLYLIFSETMIDARCLRRSSLGSSKACCQYEYSTIDTKYTLVGSQVGANKILHRAVLCYGWERVLSILMHLNLIFPSFRC